MGITGLLPFLNKSSRRANVREYATQTVAIDAYCWLHKGAFSCADKLVMNEPTLMYVSYCMKFVNMLLAHNIKPILVFDGRYLPAKAETEKKRRENRAINLKKGAELLRNGQIHEGRNYLRRSVDVTHEMALNLIKECRERNIDCIVAPYEADAQLAYLNIKNIAQIVITEDSDLLLFGCLKVLFKMDINGNGILIEKDKLYLSMGIRHDTFSMDKFRYMCILSGCDYLPSLPGIGLSKARKFVNRMSEQNIYESLLKLPISLHMWNLVVTDDYRQRFMEADRTFKYQLVYDPIERRQVPLNETENDCDIVGEKLDEEVAFQLAIGNVDPLNLTQMDAYHPDKRQLNHTGRYLGKSHQSIWSHNFDVHVTRVEKTTFPMHNSTKGVTLTAVTSLPLKRPLQVEENVTVTDSDLTTEYLLHIYASDGKKPCHSTEMDSKEAEERTSVDLHKSPVLLTKKNPFALKSQLNASGTKKHVGALAKFRIDFDSDKLLSSRYFDNEADCFVQENSTSALGSPRKQENETRTEAAPETEILHRDKTNSLEERNNQMNDSIDIGRKLSEFSFLSHTKQNDQNCPQNENLCQYSRETKFIDINTNEGAKYMSPYFHKDKTVLAPFNRVSSVEKKFYNSEESPEEEPSVNSSPYFSCQQPRKIIDYSEVSPLFSSASCVSQASQRKKSGTRNSTIKPTRGKQQSLLTRFGFQSRPKVQSERALET